MVLQRRYPIIVGFAGAAGLCFCYIFTHLWMETRVDIRRNQQSTTLDFNLQSKPKLGIVFPLIAEEFTYAVESLQHWPTKCSKPTLGRIDLILYFAHELPFDLDHQMGNINAHNSCFKNTKVVSAALRLEVRHDFTLSVVGSQYRWHFGSWPRQHTTKFRNPSRVE